MPPAGGLGAASGLNGHDNAAPRPPPSHYQHHREDHSEAAAGLSAHPTQQSSQRQRSRLAAILLTAATPPDRHHGRCQRQPGKHHHTCLPARGRGGITTRGGRERAVCYLVFILFTTCGMRLFYCLLKQPCL